MRHSVMLLLCALRLYGEVTAVHLVERTDVLDGRATGPAGPYERIIAKVHFTLNPEFLQNMPIRDLGLAPRNERGRVEFTADLYVLKPRDPAKGNGTVLFEVPNRGGKAMLARFNFAASALDPRSDAEFGDLFLLERGYTLVWLGWEWDVPGRENLLRIDVPVAMLNGKPIRGVVRAEFIPAAKTTHMGLGDRGQTAYPALDEPARLTVRNAFAGKRRAVPASQWKFNADRTSIEMETGFQPGLIYELVYQAENPRVAGVGLAAVRDIVSFFKYPAGGDTLLGDQSQFIRRAIGFGSSQSGRFLRTFLYYGFNEDERGRRVFDGVWADVAGAGRGSFNHRFAQPSRDGYAYFNTLYPTDLFPFSDVPQPDPDGGADDGLLMRISDWTMPKIFYTNGSWEYWNRCAALIHTSLNGKMDAPPHPTTRLYVVSGSQHGGGQLPQRQAGVQFMTNPNDYRPLHRALLDALLDWVRDGKAPPRSRYPLIIEDELVRREKIRTNPVSARMPAHPKAACRTYYGPTFKEDGVVTVEPPDTAAPFPVLLPQVDADGIDIGGIRMPEVAAPLGTFTGWNLRSVESGSPAEMAPVAGSFFPFPRAVIEERYGSREEYLRRVGVEADKLIRSRLLLPRDKDRVAEHAAALWDFVAQPPGTIH